MVQAIDWMRNLKLIPFCPGDVLFAVSVLLVRVEMLGLPLLAEDNANTETSASIRVDLKCVKVGREEDKST